MPKQPHYKLIITALFWMYCAINTVATSSVAGEDKKTDAVLVDHVQPFFATYCVKCHGTDKPKAKVSLHNLATLSFKNKSEYWNQILEALASNEMPPEKQKKPSKSDRAKITGWIRSQLEKAGNASEWQHKLLFPEYGNYVDHEKLFDHSVKLPAYTPSRLWKRSSHLFDSQLMRGIGIGKPRYGRPDGKLSKLKQPFTLEDKSGIRDFAAILFADSATLGTLLRNAEFVVDKFLEGAMHELHVIEHGETPEDQLPKDKKGKPIRPRYQSTPKVFNQIVLDSKPPSAEQIDAATAYMFKLVVERAPSTDDLEKYRRLIKSCIAEAGNAEGLRVGLMAIAVCPEAVYRLELGQGPADKHGRQMLSPANLAYAIAYALTDEPPDQAMVEAAKSGRLKTRADVAREVTRLWDDDAIRKPRILRFFHEYFGYHRAPGVFKDEARFKGSYDRGNVAEKLVADADVLVKHIVRQDKNVLAELLTTDRYFVGHSGDNEAEKKTQESIAKFYDYLKDKGWKDWPYSTPKEHAAYVRKIDRMFAHPNGNVVKGWMSYLTRCDKAGITPMPTPRGLDWIRTYNLDEKTFDYPAAQPFVLDKDKRAGILMHPAWLIAHSLNLDNDPIRRGKLIRERLLGGTVPELPITVDASIPDEPDQSLRHRFRVTRADECWRCHIKMNPLGMPFEGFDDFGRHRTVEQFHTKGKSAPINANGNLEGTTDASLDGRVTNAIDLVDRLAKSTRVRQSFVRHAFRYWMGRNEILSDASTLVAADDAYVKHDGSFRALVISLLTSDSFLYRKPIESE